MILISTTSLRPLYWEIIYWVIEIGQDTHKISIYTQVKYIIQFTHCNENHSNWRVLYGQIIYPVLSKFDKKCRKHQDLIYLCLWVQYSYYAKI
jgi:hypothetical protein